MASEVTREKVLSAWELVADGTVISVRAVMRVPKRFCCAFALLVLPLALSAQHISYSTVPNKTVNATVWHVNACSATATKLDAGLFYGHLAAHGAKPMFNVEALAIFNEAPSMSVPYRLVEYAGWAAAGAGVLMTTDTIKVTQEVKVAVNFGGAFLNVAIPLVRSKIPSVAGDLAGWTGE